MTQIYSFADIPVKASFSYGYTAKMCEGYITSSAPVTEIRVDGKDIEYERKKATGSYPDAYLESLAFYRKFAASAVDYGVLLMHGSAIGFDNEAYIYSAPSGTGKSTHTALCRKLYGSRVRYINDDKPLLRFSNGEWKVYGSPWDGKEHLSNNISLPLRGLCILNRGEENSICPVSGAEAFAKLYPRILHFDDPVKSGKAVNLIFELMKTPVWNLSCNMTTDAAKLSLNTMKDR